MNKILILGVVLFLIGNVDAGTGNVGDPCSNPYDCNVGIACHNSVCSQNCFAHSECNNGGYCNQFNECTSMGLILNVCTNEIVCPECECTPDVCDTSTEFSLGLDGLIYCGGMNNYCGNDGQLFTDNNVYYFPGHENAFYCGQMGGWSPICPDGKLWNTSISLDNFNSGYTACGGPVQGCVIPTETDFANLLDLGCILKPSTPVPEFPSPIIPLVAVFGVCGAAYIMTRRN